MTIRFYLVGCHLLWHISEIWKSVKQIKQRIFVGLKLNCGTSWIGDQPIHISFFFFLRHNNERKEKERKKETKVITVFDQNLNKKKKRSEKTKSPKKNKYDNEISACCSCVLTIIPLDCAPNIWSPVVDVVIVVRCRCRRYYCKKVNMDFATHFDTLPK